MGKIVHVNIVGYAKRSLMLCDLKHGKCSLGINVIARQNNGSLLNAYQLTARNREYPEPTVRRRKLRR